MIGHFECSDGNRNVSRTDRIKKIIDNSLKHRPCRDVYLPHGNGGPIK